MGDTRTLADLLEELERWRVRAARGKGKTRVSLRDLSTATGIPHNSLSGYLSGTTLMPCDVLDAVVLALGASREEAREWATAWESAADAEVGTVVQPVQTDVPKQLPATVSEFTGRQSYLKQLDEFLAAADHAVTISVIAGTAGVGKTALAVQWAHSVVGSFPDGQLYVNLRGYGADEPTPTATALERLLRALGVDKIPADLDERAALYRSLLSGRRVLVVLDNARTTDQVRPLLPGTAGCLALVTSRNRLTGLVARDGAHRLELARLPDDEACELLEQLLDGRRAHATPQACASLIRVCAGLPLALRLAAELLVDRPEQRVSDLVAELAGTDSALDALGVGEDPLSDVRAVLSWSYHVLDPASARLFRLLRLIPGPVFDIRAAANLAGLAVPDARRQIDALAAAHLLEQDDSGRYSFHDLLRAYAAEICLATDTAEERHAAVGRYLDWCLHTASAAMDQVRPHRLPLPVPPRAPLAPGPDLRDADAARAWLAAERTGLLAAARHAGASGRLSHSQPLFQTLWPYYFADS
jgi:hypothetical protein